MPKIVRETHTWGVVLHLKPFNDPRHSATEINAEVLPRPGRTEIKVWFTGIPYNAPIYPADGTVWIEGLRAIMDEARAVAKDFREKAPKKKPPKKPSSTKKKSKK